MPYPCTPLPTNDLESITGAPFDDWDETRAEAGPALRQMILAGRARRLTGASWGVNLPSQSGPVDMIVPSAQRRVVKS